MRCLERGDRVLLQGLTKAAAHAHHIALEVEEACRVAGTSHGGTEGPGGHLVTAVSSVSMLG